MFLLPPQLSTETQPAPAVTDVGKSEAEAIKTIVEQKVNPGAQS